MGYIFVATRNGVAMQKYSNKLIESQVHFYDIPKRGEKKCLFSFVYAFWFAFLLLRRETLWDDISRESGTLNTLVLRNGYQDNEPIKSPPFRNEIWHELLFYELHKNTASATGEIQMPAVPSPHGKDGPSWWRWWHNQAMNTILCMIRDHHVISAMSQEGSW